MLRSWPSLVVVATLTSQACFSDSTGPKFDLTCNIPSNLFFSGGVDRDGIPALTSPEVVPASEGDFITDAHRVLGVVVNGVARAYPMAVLWWHEVVNDTLGGGAALVTYCPLTGSGIAFDPRVGGQLRNFGVSGLLYENNLVMFDRQTESLWNQMLLGSQCGVERGTDLQRIPVVETTWGDWKELYPRTTVVTFNTGHDRFYGTYPYPGYDEPTNPRVLFPTSGFSLRRRAKELNFGLFDGGDAVVYPFGFMDELGAVATINDSLNGTPFLVTWNTADSVAIGFHRHVNGQVLTFSIADSTSMTLIDAETGTTWDRRGAAISGTLQGEVLNPIADAYVAFWFAWDVYYPGLRLVEQ